MLLERLYYTIFKSFPVQVVQSLQQRGAYKRWDLHMVGSCPRLELHDAPVSSKARVRASASVVLLHGVFSVWAQRITAANWGDDDVVRAVATPPIEVHCLLRAKSMQYTTCVSIPAHSLTWKSLHLSAAVLRFLGQTFKPTFLPVMVIRIRQKRTGFRTLAP